MSTAFGSFVESRFDPSPRTLALALGDLLLIALFVALGELRHEQTGLVRTGMTLLSFLVGWGVAASLVGAYSPRASRSVGSAATLTAVSWLLGTLLAQGLRATALFPGDAALTFLLVSLGVGLVLLVPWRVLAAFLS